MKQVMVRSIYKFIIIKYVIFCIKICTLKKKKYKGKTLYYKKLIWPQLISFDYYNWIAVEDSFCLDL